MKSHTTGRALWAYRYRAGGRGSRCVQRCDYISERDAGEALLAQYDAQPEPIE